MSKFFIALNVGTREQRNAVTAHFQAQGWKLWHHMEDIWLLANVPNNVTAKQIAEEISNITLVGEHTKLVVKVPDGKSTYWGRGPKDGWAWMKEFWGPAE